MKGANLKRISTFCLSTFSMECSCIFLYLLCKIFLKGGYIMKKCTCVFLISFFLLFNSIPALAVNVFKEGVYKASDFNLSTENLYSVQNVSQKDNVYVLLFDENQLQVQSIRLGPQSGKYNLLPLKPDYRIVIVGKGEVYIK